MRINERFDQLEEKIHRLEKEVEALKAGQQTATLEGEPIGKAAPEKKAAGTAGATAGTAGTAEKAGKTRKTTTK